MSHHESLKCVSMEAGQDLSAHQYRFVTVASDGQIDPTGAGLRAEGVLQDTPAAAGTAALVAVGGITKVVASAAITVGADVAAAANGKAAAATADDEVLGVAMETAAADGDVIAVLFMPRGVPVTS